jgi:hypothetical protein
MIHSKPNIKSRQDHHKCLIDKTYINISGEMILALAPLKLPQSNHHTLIFF